MPLRSADASRGMHGRQHVQDKAISTVMGEQWCGLGQGTEISEPQFPHMQAGVILPGIQACFEG